MLHIQPIPPHLTRHGAVGKPRRAFGDGDPASGLKDITRFKPIPQPAPSHLAVPFSVFDPKSESGGPQSGQILGLIR
jgi:hypothetical protein